MSITGKNIIGFELAASGTATFQAANPATSISLPELFYNATAGETSDAVAKAANAFVVYNQKSATEKAAFLDAIADEIMAMGDALIERAMSESGLPAARLTGERGRTTSQLKMFAQLLREGSWVNACIETALPDRQPLPKPDIRRMMEPIGPVVVFGASNFPFAYSAAGGDTASALAAGCPVIVKAHPSHPGTDELVSQAIISAAKKTNMPDGVYSMVHCNNENAIALITQPQIKAVGFTGSRKGGMALFNAAVNRPEPIPVYAEMSAVNPVIILPGAAASNGEAIANGLAASVTLGVGQFCTNPGLIFMVNDAHTTTFLQKLAAAIEKSLPATMLSKNICANYESGVARLKGNPAVAVLSSSGTAAAAEKTEAVPYVFTVQQTDFIADISLSAEVFGPATTVVLCNNTGEIEAALKTLEGQLTATLHASGSDAAVLEGIISLLKEKAGRLVFGGFPTGVEVCDAMVHGGPFPATSDGRTTSVGTPAIQRFVRPVAYQNFPQHLLPDALKDSNPLHILRQINGAYTKDAVA
ncbi:MAG: aldehyde dehydrogenase (NADP(+)) [Ferruginibacter sp.]